MVFSESVEVVVAGLILLLTPVLLYVSFRAYRRFVGAGEFKSFVKWTVAAVFLLLFSKLMEILAAKAVFSIGEWAEVVYNLFFLVAMLAAIRAVFLFDAFSKRFGFAEAHLPWREGDKKK